MPAPVPEATISESWGIPKGKNLCIDVDGTLLPLFTGRLFGTAWGLQFLRLTQAVWEWALEAG
jgi:hypothetical protein